ncbi:MAG TPA: ACT domain-containing protein [Pyrinomonadaceae bacterium]|jgi:ACT domain-containing protein|nr:ACT domain-containing protein [Pyrinomonadaceae bacterium]
MANEELIYRITRAVYGRLGAQADERTVENLVTDIYRAIEPVVEGDNNNGGGTGERAGRRGLTSHGGEAEGSSDRLIVSVFGVDNPGIVAGVAQILAESGCSIADINQTVVQGKFAMVIIANSTNSNAPVATLKERFRAAGDKLGVRIYAQREDLFNAMHRI